MGFIYYPHHLNPPILGKGDILPSDFNILVIGTNVTLLNEAYAVFSIGLDYSQGALIKTRDNDTEIVDLR